MNRAKNAKLILWLITGFATAVVFNRLVFGLGATTNLNDATPWGLWIGFKLGLVALAAGGFVVTAIFYVMKREEFHPFVKPAVLTAFLGYLSFVFSLVFDLGLPWNIWHMIIYWNPKSPLFEVGWCVMLYLTVLLLEFSPVPLEKSSRYAKIRNFLMKYRLIFIFLGIMLSTLHQSSLGSLFLIMPSKIYPLWYSAILPVQFFISAVAAGLIMVAFENLVLSWLYYRKPDNMIVNKLLKIAAWVLIIYFIVKIIDVIAEGNLYLIFNGSWQSNLFILEVLASAVIPIILFGISRLRNNIKIQWIGSLIVINGIALNRIDVAGLVMLGATGDSYVPSWTEVTVSLGIVSIALLIFLFVVENFNVLDDNSKEYESILYTAPSFDYSSRTWLGMPETVDITKHSLAFIISFAVGMAIVLNGSIKGKGIENIKVYHASGIDTLFINGNRDDQYVKFPHQAHIAMIGKDKCNKCHHLTLPGYKLNSCSECHNNMYKDVNFFKHDRHTSPAGADLKCNDCHICGVNRSALTAKKCTACHSSYNFNTKKNSSTRKYGMPSYTNAMHGLCITCHATQSKLSKDKPDLTLCSTCHNSRLNENLNTDLKWNIAVPHFNSVILPVLPK